MLKSLPTLFLLSTLALTTSCASIKRDFNPPIVGESEVLKISVSKMQQKKDRFRIWTTMQNLTDSTLRVEPSLSSATAGGVTAPGGRLVGIHTIAGFTVLPRAIKAVTMEYRGITPTSDVTVEFKNITAEGKDGTTSVKIIVPAGNKKGTESVDDSAGGTEESK